MAHEATVSRSLPRAARAVGVALLALAWSAQAPGQSRPGAAGSIFTCIDASGKRLTSDRLIPQCTDREQRVLNRDGSLQRVVPPSMTADERTAFEAEQRKLAAERSARLEAVRADRLLKQRYPDEAAHELARAAAVDRARESLAESKKRLEMLATERKPLLDEAEFYQGKALPAKLRQQFDANDAAVQAQRSLIANAENEIVRINALYDTERARLEKLWGGALPGSLGPLVMPEPATPGKAAKK